MRGDKALCLICRRTTLMVPGRAAHLPPYWWFVARWEDPATILTGCAHYTCVRSAPYRTAFRDEVVELLTKGRHIVTIRLRDAPEPVTIERSVPGYVSGAVFTGDECQVFTSPNNTRFLVVENSGPFHTLEPVEARAVAAGEPAYRTTFGMDVQLERPLTGPAAKPQTSFAELVDSLGIGDCYPDADAVELTEYHYDPDRGRLTYGTKATRPIPHEAAEAVGNLLAT